MSDKAQAMINELVSACIAFGRQVEPDWQTRIEKAQRELREYVAELEADKELLNSCESALISMVQQFFYSKAGENIFRHSFMSAEEEAAEYLVEHSIARWVGKNKSAICFNEVQE